LIGFLCIALFALLVIIAWITRHLGPLSNDEVHALAERRRSRAIRKYFKYERHEVPVDKDFKKRMDPRGKMYRTSESLMGFPSVAASLLKYKKHEWVILAFESNQVVKQFWTNKGVDRTRVPILLSIGEILRTCREEGASSVLFFHNHPNPDPTHYSTAIASEADKEISRNWADSLAPQGVSLLSFVCERGTAHEYFRSVSRDLLPTHRFAERIAEVNGASKLRNLRLHFERLF